MYCTYLKGFREGGEKNSSWLLKTMWTFPFRSFPNSFSCRPWLLVPCLTVWLFALCSSPPPSWRVVGEAVVLCAEVKHLAKGLPAAHSHCTAGVAKPTLRASPRFIYCFFFSLCDKTIAVGLNYQTGCGASCSTPLFFFCSNWKLGEKRVLSQPQANAPALFFLSSPCALCLSALSLPFAKCDTNSLRKIGPTAKATTDFLFNVLQPVAWWHKITLARIKQQQHHVLLEADAAMHRGYSTS